jgi:transposase
MLRRQACARALLQGLDGATAHRATALRVPERLTLVSLPAYTPELNPMERLWPLVKVRHLQSNALNA